MPPLIPVEQLSSLSELLTALRTRLPLGILKTGFKTLTVSPIYDDLFVSAPRGEEFFTKTTKKAQKAALTHFLENQASPYLSAALEALEKKEPLSAHKIVSDLHSFSPKTLHTINALCSRFLSRLEKQPRDLIPFQKALETTLTTHILHAWAKEADPGEYRDEAVDRINAFISAHEEIELDLTGFELHSLPDVFHLPVFKRLTHLYLAQNRLTTLPHLKPLIHLEECVLSENFFQAIPDMSDFSKLSLLDLSHNPFSTLNEDYILGLSPACNLILKIPEKLNEALDLIAIANDSRGHEQIFLEAKLESNKEQIERILRFLYHPYTEIPSLSRITDQPKMLRAVIPWLSLFMEDMIDYRDKETTDQVKELLRNFLEEVEENPLFEHLFLVIIQEAMTTCIDGRTLSLVHLSLAKTESNCDLRNLQETFDTFVKLGICKLLEEYALTKIRVLRAFHPEIDTFDREIILSYLLEMREHFNLPLEDLKMMFKACTQLTKEDFTEAKTDIEAILSDPKKLHQLLIKNVSWVNLLKIHHPDDYQKIEDALASIEDLSLLKIKREEFLVTLSEKSCMAPSILSIPHENMPLLQALAAWGLTISSKKLFDLFSKSELEKEIQDQIIYNYNELIGSDYPQLSLRRRDLKQKIFDPLVLLQVIKDELFIELPGPADKRQKLES